MLALRIALIAVALLWHMPQADAQGPFSWRRALLPSAVISGSGEASTPRLGVDNLYAVHSPHLVVTGYAGATVRIRESGGNTEQDFTPNSAGWVTSAAVLAFLNGANGFVVAEYDQTGNSRHASQSTAGNQPAVNTSGTYITIGFATASSQYLSVESAAGFARNIGAASLVAVRKHAALAPVANNVVMFVSNNAGGTRMQLAQTSGSGFRAFGRRLDADGLAQTAGIADSTAYGVLITRFEWSASDLFHQIDAAAESNTSFQTNGVTSDTDSSAITIGSNSTPAQFMNGTINMTAFVRDKLTDGEVSTLVADLAALKL